MSVYFNSSEYFAGSSDKHEFQAETRMLLDIVAKSLYSEKEVSDQQFPLSTHLCVPNSGVALHVSERLRLQCHLSTLDPSVKRNLMVSSPHQIFRAWCEDQRVEVRGAFKF